MADRTEPMSKTIGDPAVGEMAEAITRSVLRAMASREEVQKILRFDDSFVLARPWIIHGGIFLYGRGQVQNVVATQMSGELVR